MIKKEIFTIEDFDITGKTILLRVDFDSPIDPVSSEILDSSKINAHLDTIKSLEDAKVVILSSQSTAGMDDFTTLEKHANKLSEHLGRTVNYADDLFCSKARHAITNMKKGDILILENTNFYAEEYLLKNKDYKTQAQSYLVRRLAPLTDLFVNDAFKIAYKSTPSTVGFSEVLPNLAGKLMEKELSIFSKILSGEVEMPLVAILGGTNVEKCIKVIENLLKKNIADCILTCGLVANLFLSASGISLGKSAHTLTRSVHSYERVCSQAKKLLEEYREKINLPVDFALNNEGKRLPAKIEDLPSDKEIYDIGLETIVEYRKRIKDAKTVILCGLPGICEFEEFSIGSVEILTSIATENICSILSGGSTGGFAERLELQDKIYHISSGNRACLDLLTGTPLPVIEALKHSKKLFEKGPFLRKTKPL